MEYYSAIKKNEIMPFAATWMDLEIIILSEVRERQIPCDITYMCNLKINKGTSLADQWLKTPRVHCRGHGSDPWSGY